jgi:hypothetical protein
VNQPRDTVYGVYEMFQPSRVSFNNRVKTTIAILFGAIGLSWLGFGWLYPILHGYPFSEVVFMGLANTIPGLILCAISGWIWRWVEGKAVLREVYYLGLLVLAGIILLGALTFRQG